MRRNTVIRGSLAALVLSLIAAGCGGDDAITSEEFAAKAGEICATGDRELDAAGRELFAEGEPRKREYERFVFDQVVPTVQGQIDEIRALGVPEGDQGRIEEILDKAQSGLDEVREDPDRLGDTDLEEASQLMGEYGVEECAGSD